ncbi:MAG: hypothetical protein V7712_14785, partial [Halopseudomonas sp.]
PFQREGRVQIGHDHRNDRSRSPEYAIVTPNDSLGGEAPFFLCRTELGGRQAYRVLRAIEWGGPV